MESETKATQETEQKTDRTAAGSEERKPPPEWVRRGSVSGFGAEVGQIVGSGLIDVVVEPVGVDELPG